MNQSHEGPGLIQGGRHGDALNLNQKAVLMVFFSGKIEDARKDDFRFSVDQWPIQA
jgi:hypothetical protein